MNWRQEPDGRPPDGPDDTWNYERAHQDEQPTTVMTRCGYCRSYMVQVAEKQDYCMRCVGLWRLRNRVASGELSDWYGIAHHIGALTQRTPVFEWGVDFEDAVWCAMHLLLWCPWGWDDTRDDDDVD